MSTTIESLELEVKQNGNSAVQGIDALSASLTRLKSAAQGGVGLTSVTNQLRNLNTALTSMDTSSADKINRLANSLEKLKSLGSLKISSSIANQLKSIGNTASSLAGVDFSSISKISTALSSLQDITKSSGLSSSLTQLNKIPDLAKALDAVDWSKFTANIQKLTNSLKPLSKELNAVSAASSKLPANLQKVSATTPKVSSSNEKVSKSYTNLLSKLAIAVVSLKKVASVIGSWINQSNKYVEDLNLFTATMGQYAGEAKEYAEQVSELMGIDPAEWMRNQGIFNTIITGFGVASDKAYLMSKNLTQLGYDLSSFFNVSFEDSMQKLQSAISGELEPVRRLGYDLSQAALKQITMDSENYADSLGNIADAMSDVAMSSYATAQGYSKSFNEMTQAEKSQLRYVALMNQVTVAQGDMARTLNAPANQLRILQAQVTQAARALGNIFIPALNAILPYAIAVAKAIRLVANSIANFFGFSLPEIDYSGLTTGATAVADAAESAEDGYGGAAKAAKKLKDNLLGIDELNIIRPDDDSSGGGGGVGGGVGGGGFDIDLPEYDFLGDLVKTRTDSIVDKFTSVFDKLKKKVEESGLIQAFDRLKEAISNFSESNFVKKFKEIINVIGDDTLTTGLDLLTDSFNLLADILNGDLKSGLNDYKDLMLDITFDPLIILADVADRLLETDLGGWLKDLKDRLKDIDVTKLEAFEKFETALGKVKESFDKVKQSLQKLGDVLEETGISDAVKEFIEERYSSTLNMILEALAFVLDEIADALEIISSALDFISDLLSGDFKSALEDINNLVDEFTVEPLFELFDLLFGTDLQDNYKDFDLWNWITVTGKDVKKNIIDPISSYAKDHAVELLVEGTVKLIEWIDELKEKWIDFKARMTKWVEVLKDKTIPFIAKMTKWKDSLKDKIIPFKAKLTKWVDVLIGKSIDFRAKLTTWRDGLSNKIIDFKARLTSWTDSLKDKVLSFKAEITGFIGNAKEKLKTWIGMENGGVISSTGVIQTFANGGIVGRIPSYANGTPKAHGTMFIAGENGDEVVGHINGATEVLNRFQMGQIMHSAITSGMALYIPVWKALNNTLIQSANAIIRSILVSAEAVNMNLANQATYDPKNILSQSVYEESSGAYGKAHEESSIAATMRDFYREYIEPTLTEIAADAKRQADKEEQTIVQIGNRTINDVVKSQQKANGYVFAT